MVGMCVWWYEDGLDADQHIYCLNMHSYSTASKQACNLCCCAEAAWLKQRCTLCVTQHCLPASFSGTFLPHNILWTAGLKEYANSLLCHVRAQQQQHSSLLQNALPVQPYQARSLQ